MYLYYLFFTTIQWLQLKVNVSLLPVFYNKTIITTNTLVYFYKDSRNYNWTEWHTRSTIHSDPKVKRWLLRYSHVWRHSITLQLRTLLTSHCPPTLVFAHRDKTRTLSSFLVDACKLTIVGAVINLRRLTGNKRYSSLNISLSPPTLAHQDSLSLLGSCQDSNIVMTHNIFSLCSWSYRRFLRHIFLAAKPKFLTTWK